MGLFGQVAPVGGNLCRVAFVWVSHLEACASSCTQTKMNRQMSQDSSVCRETGKHEMQLVGEEKTVLHQGQKRRTMKSPWFMSCAVVLNDSMTKQVLTNVTRSK